MLKVKDCSKVNTYIVPESGRSGRRESESHLPEARSGSGILSHGHLFGVVVPRADQVAGLDVSGSAKLECLSSRHVEGGNY